MHFWWLPTLGFSLWPCVILLIVFVPVAVYHERNWRRTMAAYSDARRAAGATDGEWPPPEMRSLMGVQPRLLFFMAGLLACMTAVGLGTLLVWPHKLPGFDYPLNFYDRPYLWTMVVAGTAAVIGAVALGLDLATSPWARVANRVLRAVYVSPEARERLFVEALAADPGVPQPAE